MISKIWTIATVASVLVSAAYAHEISDETLKQHFPRLQDGDIKVRRAGFSLFDHDNNGHVTVAEITTTLNKITPEAATQAQIDAVMSGDKDSSKSIDLLEFVTMVEKAQSLDLLFKKVFDDMDTNHSGSVSADEYRTWLANKGWNFSLDQVKSMIKDVDGNDDNVLDHLEMLKALKTIVTTKKQ